jgi:hypothetical protein
VKFRFRAPILASFLTAASLHADWKDEIGFTRLQLLAGPELPTATNQGLSHVEPSLSEVSLIYAPDIASATFAGKSFTFKSGASGTSWHATHTARNFFGIASLLPGATDVDLYDAGDWINSGFLNHGEPDAPETETRAVQSHSWIVTTDWTVAEVEEGNRRLDFAIDRDGFVCVVGENNGSSILLPQFLGQSYHTISVGRDDGLHSAGLTAYDGINRMKPDIVAPSTSPEGATSWTTPMVAGASGLLYAKLAAAPYSLTGADRPRVIKALLMASATKNTMPGWDNNPTSPLDSIYGAGELNVNHAYSTLRAGRAIASGVTQYSIRGWAAEAVPGVSSKTYFFSVPAGAPSTPFSAALTWHRSVQSSTWTAALADLNFRLHHASGFTLGSEVAASLSTVDNVELVYQSALAPGDYALVVENTSADSTAYGLAWHSLPAATVAATSPVAREFNTEAGVITLTRTGDTTLALYVPLTIGGTAIAGTHYLALPASVTIPAGQSSSTLQVIPVSDSLAQGNRTVTVSIAADFALVRDAAQSGIVTIEDMPFDAWRLDKFTGPELGNPAISGATADPDGDQLANLIEYALDLAPKSPSTSPVAMIDLGGYLALSAQKNPDAIDITGGAETTGNLASWNPAFIVTDTDETFEARDTVLMSGAAKRFIRLKITRP